MPDQIQGDETRVDFAEIKDVEILRIGAWRGSKGVTTIDAAVLDDLVAAFDKAGFSPPVKLGHDETVGAPAMGWVANLRRAGERLIADLVDVPADLFEAIRERRFDAVSAELFSNIKRNDQTFRHALRAVALLGAEIPAVAGLKPLRQSLAAFSDCDSDGVTVITIPNKEGNPMSEHKTDKTPEGGSGKDGGDDLAALTARLDAAEAGRKADAAQIVRLTADLKAASEKEAGDSALEVKRLNERLAEVVKLAADAAEDKRQTVIGAKVDKCRLPAFREHFAALYDLATREGTEVAKFSVRIGGAEKAADISAVALVDDMIARLNKFSEKLFREHAIGGDMKRDDVPATDDPGVEIDRLTQAWLVEHTSEDYGAAMSAVLRDPANSEIAHAYRNHGRA